MKSLQHILSNCPHQMRACHIERALVLHLQLAEGKPYLSLGGKRIKQNPEFVRFKISSSLRLIYRDIDHRLEPHSLITRQGFERTVKRR